MDDMIRRSDVIDKVEVINWYHVNADGKLVSGAAEEADAFIHYSDAVEAIEKAPAVDAVEVVRCRECKHNLCPDKPNSVCGLDMPIFDICGYCSEGERKEDGDGDG